MGLVRHVGMDGDGFGGSEGREGVNCLLAECLRALDEGGVGKADSEDLNQARREPLKDFSSINSPGICHFVF